MTYPNADVYQRLAELEAQVRYLYEHAGLQMPAGALAHTELPTFAAASQGSAIPVDVQQALSSGNKIAAIKAYREATGASLSEAKAVLDQF